MKNSYDNIFFKKVPIDNESNVECNPISIAALPRIIPVEPPIVNINKNNILNNN